METLRALATRLDEASATLATLARTVTVSDPPHPAFGAHAEGRPGPAPAVDHRHRRPGPGGHRGRSPAGRRRGRPARRRRPVRGHRRLRPPPVRPGGLMDALDRLAEPGLDLLAREG